MHPKTKKIIAYSLNLIMVGAGFIIYNHILAGIVWLFVFILAYLSNLIWGIKVSIILRLIVIVISYVHLYKIIEKTR